MRQTFLVLALLTVAPPARADIAPMIHPSRDVAVEYRSSRAPARPGGRGGQVGDDAVLQQKRPHPDRWRQRPRLCDP